MAFDGLNDSKLADKKEFSSKIQKKTMSVKGATFDRCFFSFLLIVILSPLKNTDRDPIGNQIGNLFERKFWLLMHVDAFKAQEIGGKKLCSFWWLNQIFNFTILYHKKMGRLTDACRDFGRVLSECNQKRW